MSSDSDGPNDSMLRMRWMGRHSTEPRLIEIAVSSLSSLWWEEQVGFGDSEVRHRDGSVVDVDLRLNDTLNEDEEPAPDGTPVLFGSGKRLLSTEYQFWVMFDDV